MNADGDVPFVWDCGLGCPPIMLRVDPVEMLPDTPAPRLALAVRAHLLGTHNAEEYEDLDVDGR